MWTVQGEGVCQMTILLHKPYLLKVSTKGNGAKNSENLPTWFMDGLIFDIIRSTIVYIIDMY